MKHLFAFLALALICLNTSAIEAGLSRIDSPGTVYVYGEPKEVSIKIVNEEDSSQDFSIEFSAPTQFELSQYNGTVAGQRSKTVTLTLYPRSDLTGQTYESKLEVILGQEKHVKKLRMVFREEQEPGQETAGEEKIAGEVSTGLVVLGMPLENATELTLNALLVLIAAVLLIAFIARFVKRMEGK